MRESSTTPPVLKSTWVLSDLAPFLLVLRRHLVLLCSAVLAGLLVMVVVMVVSGPSYTINAKVLVRLGRETMAPPVVGAASDGQSQGLVQRRPEDVATEVELFNNPHLVQQTVEALGPDFFFGEPPETGWQRLKALPRALRQRLSDLMRETLVAAGLRQPTTPMERVAVTLNAGLSVEQVPKSDVIGIGLTYPDPQAGVAFLDRYIAFAMQNHVQAYEAAGDRSFLQKQRDDREADLRGAEGKLLAARTLRDAYWSGSDQRALLIKRQVDLDGQQDAARAALAQLNAEIRQTETALALVPSTTRLSETQSRSKAADDLKGREHDLEINLARLQAELGDRNPDVVKVRRQLDEVRRLRGGQADFIRESGTSGPNPTYDTLRRDLIAKRSQRAGQEAVLAEIARQVTALQAKQHAAETLDIDISRANRAIEEAKRNLDNTNKALQDAALGATMDSMAMSNLKLLMPPTAELVPTSPSIGRLLFLGALGGFALAAGYVLIRDAALWRRAGPDAPALG